MAVPYTYLLGWTKQNKFYYGVRYAKNCAPDDLWVKYKTSSKHVKKFAHKYGDPDIIQIRKTFSNSEKARIWENKVLRRINVINDKRFLNCANNISIDPMLAGHGKSKGKTLSIETKEKIRQANLGKNLSNETRLKISNTFKHKTAQELANINSKRSASLMGRIAWNTGIKFHKKIFNTVGENNGMYGKQHSHDTKTKMSLSKQNRVWINKDTNIKFISIDILPDYISSGWNVGRGARK